MLFFRYFLEIVSFFLVIFLVVGEFCSYMKVEKNFFIVFKENRSKFKWVD